MTMKEKTLSLTKKLMSTTRRKFSKEFKAKVVLESLKERETLECYKKIFSQIKYSSVKIVSILGGDIFKYKDLNRLLELIKRYNLDSHLWVNYLNIPEEVYLLSSDVFYNILVTFPIRKNSIERILERCKTNLKLHFLIENESQYSYSINMINQFKIEKYNIIPIYIGRNKKIFSENIF